MVTRALVGSLLKKYNLDMAKARKRKPARSTSPLDTDADHKVLAVQFNRRELDALRKGLNAHAARGSRANVSQLIRWAVTRADFSKMPDVP